MMFVIIIVLEDNFGDVMGYVIVCCGCVDGMEVCGNI